MFPPEIRKAKKKGSKKRKAATVDNSEDKGSDEENKGKKLCKFHGTCGHTADEYRTLTVLIRHTKQKKGKQIKKKKSISSMK